MTDDHKTRLAKMKAQTEALRAALDGKVTDAQNAIDNAQKALDDEEKNSTKK